MPLVVGDLSFSTKGAGAAAKVGAGIDHFSVVGTLFKARAFEIIRLDGSRDTFSYKCLAPPRSAQSKLLEALRAEVQENILQQREAYFIANGDPLGQIPCALTGELITIDDSHADHAPPFTFQVLATAFLRARAREFEHSYSLLFEHED